MSETRTRRVVPAPPEQVYAVLLDPNAVARWRVPDGMSAVVHEWEPVVGGRFRVSLTYDDPTAIGKSEGATDTYAGWFTDLVPGERVVEVLSFEGADDAPMTQTTLLRPVDGGTEVTIEHTGVPASVRAEDDEEGTRMALANLAAEVARRV